MYVISFLLLLLIRKAYWVCGKGFRWKKYLNIIIVLSTKLKFRFVVQYIYELKAARLFPFLKSSPQTNIMKLNHQRLKEGACDAGQLQDWMSSELHAVCHEASIILPLGPWFIRRYTAICYSWRPSNVQELMLFNTWMKNFMMKIIIHRNGSQIPE